MCKILSIEVSSATELINVVDDANLFMVVTNVKFKPKDVTLKKEYCLNLLGYNVPLAHDSGSTVVEGNEDVSVGKNKNGQIDLLAEKAISIKAAGEQMKIETVLALPLGKFDRKMLHVSRKLKVFETIANGLHNSTKWSKTITSQISY